MYQMVSSLGDGVVIKCGEGGLSGTYYEDVPLAYFNTRFRGRPRFTAGFGYYGQTRTLAESIKGGTLFEGFVWYYGGDCGGAAPEPTGPEPRDLLRLRESFSSQWSAAYLPTLSRFLAMQLQTAARPEQQGWAVAGELPLANPAKNPVMDQWPAAEVKNPPHCARGLACGV